MLATLTAAASGSSIVAAVVAFLAAQDWAGLALQAFAYLSPLVAIGLGSLSIAGRKLIMDKVKHQGLQTALVVLETMAFNAAAAVQQTYVDAIKAASADGKLTDEEKERAMQSAIAELLGMLGPDWVKTIREGLGIQVGAFDGFLTTIIEAQVAKLRASQPRLLKGVTVIGPPADSFDALPREPFTRKPAFGPPAD